MRAGGVVDAPGQSNTDTHQGVDRSLDAPSTRTDMAEASRNGRWQPPYDFAGRRTGHRTRSLPAFASGESGNFRFDAGARRAKRAGRLTGPLATAAPGHGSSCPGHLRPPPLSGTM